MNRSRKPTKSNNSSTLRIIGGKHRGRKLPIPELEGLRPTADRIRETLFNWLQFDVSGMRVLDLYAGTGALGLEALSRDAKEAVFVEPQKQAFDAIRSSLEVLGLRNAQVINQTCEQFFRSPQPPFDLVFVDPPFAMNLWHETLESLITQDYLKEGSWIYVECPKHQQFEIPQGLQVVKDKTAGQVRFRLLQKMV